MNTSVMVDAPQVSWWERKQGLKKEIISYFHKSGANLEQIKAACGLIKFHGELSAELAYEHQDDSYDEYLESEVLPEKFSPRHRQAVLGFWRRFEKLEFELLEFLDKQRPWKECWARDDFEYEDWLDTQPKVEVIITHENIIVNALEFVENLQDRLPKGYEYKGKGRWEYPLKSRCEVEELGYPVLLYPGVGEVIVEKFSPKKYKTEKVNFEIWSPVFNVSEGLREPEELGVSPLWGGELGLENFREKLWSEIKAYLPRYKKGELPVLGNIPNWYRGSYFRYILRLAELAKSGRRVKLIYISDKQHAMLIRRCIYWLIGEVKA